MEGDKFVSTNTHPFINNSVNDSNNFFTHSMLAPAASIQSEPLRHLNDYDSNILQDGAYKTIKDETIKLEYRISRTEEEIKALDKQIQSAEAIYDYFLVNNLKEQKTLLQNELNSLVLVYQQASLSAKISGDITSGIKMKYSEFVGKIFSLVKVLFAKLPGKISSFIEIRHSLSQLESINKSVDELMTRQFPYGESTDRYNQLSKYIARANSIHSDISKLIK